MMQSNAVHVIEYHDNVSVVRRRYWPSSPGPGFSRLLKINHCDSAPEHAIPNKTSGKLN